MKRLIVTIVLAAMLSSALSGVITGVVIKSSIDAGTKNTNDKLFRAQISGCQRNNIRTAAGNKNALAEWRENVLFISLVTLTPAQQAQQTSAQRKFELAFKDRAEDVVSSLTWTPLNLECSVSPTSTQLPVSFGPAVEKHVGHQVTTTPLNTPPSIDINPPVIH